MVEIMSESTDNLTFEQALQELQQVIHKLEDGETGLEDALAQYEQGIGLLKRCYAQLRRAEQRILLLTGVDEEGKPLTQPFDHAATEEGKTEAQRRRKKGDQPDVPF
jgi:exodeoxyribonuclease VII small subunit